MVYTCCVLIKLCLINYVVGIIDIDLDKNETERKLADLEANVNHTLNILEINILDKLITHIDDKVNTLNNKINDNSEENIMRTMNMSSKIIENMEEKITQKLNATNMKIDEKLEAKATQILNESNKKFDSLKEKIAETLNSTNKKIEEKLEAKTARALNASNKEIDEKLEAKTTQTLNAVNKKIEKMLEKNNTEISNEFDSMKKDLDSTKKELDSTKKVLDSTTKELDSMRKKLFKLIRTLSCEEESLGSYSITQAYSIYDEALNHITVTSKSDGNLMYLAMHIAIKGAGPVEIRLSDKESNSEDILYYIHVGWENNQYTEFNYKFSNILRIHSPNTLSPTEFRNFYVKIVNGNLLQFGKEGDSSPLISYDDSNFSTVKYFHFYTKENKAKILYNCPAPDEGSTSF